MRALSLRQPWLNAVLYLGKNIENRRWQLNTFRGTFLLHAAKNMTTAEYRQARGFCQHAYLGDSPLFVPQMRRETFERALNREQLHFGGIIGRANLSAIILPNPGRDPRVYQAHGVDGAWHIPNQYGWILTDIEVLPFWPCPGRQGLFTIPDEELPPSYVRAA